jgi:hypothetical protein
LLLPGENTYQQGEEAWIEIQAQPNLAETTAVSVDLSLENAQVVDFEAPTSTAEEFVVTADCNQSTYFTADRICYSVAQKEPLAAGTSLGKVKVKFLNAGLASIEKTAEFVYTDGVQTKGEIGVAGLYTVEATEGDYVGCGPMDADGDGVFKIGDVASIVQRFKDTCDAGTPDYGECGPRDANNTGKIDIGDIVYIVDRFKTATCTTKRP